MAERKGDGASFTVNSYCEPSAAQASKIADSVTIGQNWTAPAKFARSSVVTGRAIGQTYWLSEKELTNIKGGVKIVVRNRNYVLVGVLSNIGWSSGDGAKQKPISKADISLHEDLILDAIQQIPAVKP